MGHSPCIASWLLKSKVSPPRQLHSLTSRKRLVADLDQATSGNLVLLQAPGGYGKTTLLSEWLHARTSRTGVSCWLSVDEDDEPATFISYLAFAAHTTGVDMTQTSLLNFDHAEHHIARAILAYLAQLERDGRPIRVIIDDGERLSREVRETVLPILLRRLPENVTLILASRDTIELDTVDLEHRGLVSRFGANDLRFQIEELKTLWERQLTAVQIKRLDEKTWGWPVLVKLLLSASRLGTFDIRHIDEAGYRDERITACFENKILSQVTPEIRQFLFDCSVLENITVAAIGELLDYPLPDTVNQLGGLVAFFVPFSGENAGYHLHPVLRAYLRKTLKTSDPDRYLALQRRATAWYSKRGRFVRAIRHARRTGDRNLLLKVLDQTGGLLLWLKEGLIQFRLIDRMLPDWAIRESPIAAFMRCIILMKAGRQSEARKLFNSTLAYHQNMVASDQMTAISVQLVALMIDAYEGRMLNDKALDALEAAVAAPSGLTDESSRGFALTFRCVAAHQMARYQEAEEYAAQAMTVFQSMGSVHGEIYIRLHQAMINALKGPEPSQGNNIHKVSSLIRQNGSFDEGIRYLKDVIAIEVRHEHVPLELDGAARLRSITPKLFRAEGWLDIFAGAFRTLAEQSFICGRPDEAAHMLDLAISFAEENSMDHLARICLAQRQIIDLLKTGSRPEFPDSDTSVSFDLVKMRHSTPWRLIEAETELALLCERLQRSQVSLAPVRIYRDQIARTGNLRTATRLNALLICADRGRCESDIQFLTTHVTSSAFSRSTLFVAEDLRSLVTDIDSEQDGCTELKQILKTQAVKIGKRRTQDPVSSVFTTQERRILERLQQKTSDKEIAIKLEISEHTVHYHLKKVYAKLRVNSRGDALKQAERLGILPPVQDCPSK